jgi:hypothetical protein
MEIINRPLVKSPNRTRSKDFPFETLAVGQAFFVPEGTVERKKFSVMMNSVGKRLSTADTVVKFSWQSGEQNGVKGAFVQRIS